MKSVLISIQPKWCELIASGRKTVEVRKTRPKLDTPFKCYIYCTNSKKEFLQSRNNVLFYCEDRDFIGGHGVGLYKRLNGKVIGEFVCKTISDVFNPEITIQLFEDGKLDKETFGEIQKEFRDIRKDTALTEDEIEEYLNGKDGYGWHISNLVIYDKPRELKEFRKSGALSYDDWLYGLYNGTSESSYEKYLLPFTVTRPPQSWCYVEGVEGK